MLPARPALLLRGLPLGWHLPSAGTAAGDGRLSAGALPFLRFFHLKAGNSRSKFSLDEVKLNHGSQALQ